MISRVDSEQFIDLMCADPGWVAVEFDAIMAAEFPRPRTPHPRRPSGPDRLPRRSARQSRGGQIARSAIRPRGGDECPQPRGRSPPGEPAMSLLISRVDPEEAAT